MVDRRMTLCPEGLGFRWRSADTEVKVPTRCREALVASLVSKHVFATGLSIGEAGTDRAS